MSWNSDWGCSAAVWGYRELCISLALGSQGCKNRSLAWGKYGIPQTGVTLAYMINRGTARNGMSRLLQYLKFHTSPFINLKRLYALQAANIHESKTYNHITLFICFVFAITCNKYWTSLHTRTWGVIRAMATG